MASSTFVTLPGNTLQTIGGIGFTFTPHSQKLSNRRSEIKDEKKVEVRWLESEADLYIKQWRRRYRQLEAIEQPFTWPEDNENYDDDWYLTARSILDLDVAYMNSEDFDKMNSENHSPGLNFLYRGSRFMFKPFDEDDLKSDEYYSYETTISIDNLHPDIVATLKAHNLIFKNGKLETINNNNVDSNKSKKKNQKNKSKHLENKCTKKEKPVDKPGQSKKSSKSACVSSVASSTPTTTTMPPKSVTCKSASVCTLPAVAIATPLLQTSHVISATSVARTTCSNCPKNTVGTAAPTVVTCSKATPLMIKHVPKPRNLEAKKPRPAKLNSGRRQMYVCEYPGCQYTSDRNFNFLRHKRTHGKPKCDEPKRQLTVCNGNLFGSPTTLNMLHDGTPFGEGSLGQLDQSDLMNLSSGSSALGDHSSQLNLTVSPTALVHPSQLTLSSSPSSLSHTGALTLSPNASSALSDSSQMNLNLLQYGASNTFVSVVNDAHQAFTLANEDFLLADRHNQLLIKDLSTLDPVLADSHFHGLALDQSLMS